MEAVSFHTMCSCEFFFSNYMLVSEENPTAGHLNSAVWIPRPYKKINVFFQQVYQKVKIGMLMPSQSSSSKMQS